MKRLFKRICVVVLGAVLPLAAFAQTSQKGLVKEYREGDSKKVLSGVEVEIVNAGSVVSDNKGGFLLEFRTLQPGQKVNVRRIEKIGYEIFNKDALDQWNINPEEPFTIIMVKSELFKKIKDQYSVMSSKSYAEQYEREKKALEEERRAGRLTEEKLREQLQALSDWYDMQLDNLSNYVDRFARIDIAELDEAERGIIELVKSGRIEEAIKKYEEFKLVEKFEAETSEKLTIEEGIKTLEHHHEKKEESIYALWDKIEIQMDVLILNGGKKDYEKVSEMLVRVAAADPSNYVILSKCIAYASWANLVATQLQLYQMCDISSVPDRQMRLLLELSYANTLTIAGQFDEAIPYLTDAMKEAEAQNDLKSKYRALAELITVYNWKMDVDMLSSLFEELCKYYDDKSIYDELPKDFQIKVNHDIGGYYSTFADYVSAAKFFNNSVAMAREMYQKVPDDVNRSEYVSELLVLGVTEMQIGEIADAISHSAEAKAIIEEAGLMNDPAYVFTYYQCVKTLATCYFYQEDYVGSELMFAEALKIAESVNSDMFVIEERTDLYNNFGYLYYVTGQYEKSEKMYLAAVEVCYDAYLENISKYIFNLFRVQINLSSLYLDMGKYELVIKYGEDAVMNCEMIYAAYPEFIRDNYVLTLQNIAKAASALGQDEYAASAMAKASEINNALN